MGVDRPTRSFLVVDLGVLECPAREAIALGAMREADLARPDLDGAVLLGTVTIEDDAGDCAVFRLPAPLGTWTAGQIQLTRSGDGQFPALLGFCSPRPGMYGVEFMPGPTLAPEELEKQDAFARQWISLEELSIPNSDQAAEHDRPCEVLEVDVLLVHRSILEPEGKPEREKTIQRRAGVKVRRKPVALPKSDFVAVDAQHLALPTATVWTIAGRIKYRLPPPLAEWVLSVVQLAVEGQELLPAEVVFCHADGAYTADFADIPAVSG